MTDQKHHEFWMVYGLGKAAPTYEHLSFESARSEAKRLAREAPGTAFYVLKAERGFVMAPPPVTEIEIDPNEIPF